MDRIKLQHIFRNLDEQFAVLQRHMRVNSIQTRREYSVIFKKFYRWVAEEFGIEKLANIGPKHLRAYVIYAQDKGLSAATILKELSAIRYWFDGISPRRYKYLPSNEELGFPLEKRPGKVDRTWSGPEIERMCTLAEELGMNYISRSIIVASKGGGRMSEILRLDTNSVDKAIKTGKIVYKGKSGKEREVEVPPEVIEALKEQRAETARGHKLFVPDGVPTHNIKARIEGFIRRHRDEVADPDWGRAADMTFHGLRHTYATNLLDELVAKGVPIKKAKYIVSESLGHNRLDIVDRYTCASSASKNKNNNT